jgi:hypothetical protein
MTDSTRCIGQARDRDSTWPGRHQCPNKSGHGPDGKYCRIHDPVRVAERRAKVMAAGNKRWEERLRPGRALAVLPKCIDAMQGMIDANTEEEQAKAWTVMKAALGAARKVME